MLVIFQTETCIWEQPYCEPTYEFKRVMTAYSRSLPPPTRAPETVPPPRSLSKTVLTATNRPTTSLTTKKNSGKAESQKDEKCDTDDDRGK